MPEELLVQDYSTAPLPERFDIGDVPDEDIAKLYSEGLITGAYSEPAYYAFMRAVSPRFYGAFVGSQSRGAGRVSLPFKAALALDSEFGVYERQTTGDCVSHGTRNAGMIDYCTDALFGETTFKGRFATENIYGYRGHGGQGASCSRLANYVSQQGPGGFLPRGVYEKDGKKVDLTKYNATIGHNWGGSGTPSWLNEIAASNKSLRVMTIKSMEEARDCIACGFGISMCSGYGFSSTRNEDGLSERSGGWNHCMAWIGVDDSEWAHKKYGGMLFLVQNSWGRFNSGPRRNDQPEGSFWIRPSIAESMIKGGGGFGIAAIRGFNRELVFDQIEQIAKVSRD